MGQEERKNKAKLEKTQVNVAMSNTEYEAAVKVLEETTGRWNRDWKAAADKFQDLEEERLDFTKSSLWTFANIASTVCVSDDASCEKVRLSLENCEVEKDIISFIKGRGTGQEIPDPPKYINFCRGDTSDTQSEASEDENYSVAQFQRTINPAFRTSSPQPSTYESHHDPNSNLARELGHRDVDNASRETTVTPQKARQSQSEFRQEPSKLQYEQSQHGPLAAVPHDPYPMDGMTMLCRTGPSSDKSSHSALRPSSRDDALSEYSNPTSFSSMDPPSGKQSPLKQEVVVAPVPEKSVQKRKSGFFSNSPFRRKSKHDKEMQAAVVVSSATRNTWSSSKSTALAYGHTPTRYQPSYTSASQSSLVDRRARSPDPVDPRATFQLNVGNNVFDVATPGRRNTAPQENEQEELDPIAQALAELKGVTKASSSRVSVDHYSGIPTPAPGSISAVARSGVPAPLAPRSTPPPSYDQPPGSRMGASQSALTSRTIQQPSQKYPSQSTKSGYGTSSPRPSTRGNDASRATSPFPRAISPRPAEFAQPKAASTNSRHAYNRSASPNPYAGSMRGGPQQSTSQFSSDYHRHQSTGDVGRAVSPAPFSRDQQASRHSGSEMSLQLAPAPQDQYGSRGSRHGGRPTTGQGKPMSSYGGNSGASGRPASQQQVAIPGRTRSKSLVDGRQFNREGRPIMHFGKSPLKQTKKSVY